MRQRLEFLGSFSLFWIAFQLVIRGIFLLYNYDLTSQLTSGEIFHAFRSGLKMDLSLAGYFVMFAAVIVSISVFVQSRWLYFILNVVSIAGLLMASIITMVDLELYRHWGFRTDITPLFYLEGAEKEALGSVEVAVMIKLLLILVALFCISLFFYSQWLMPKLARFGPVTSKKGALLYLLIAALMIIPIRGSLTVAPMNTGFVYFHKTKNYANHAAVNVLWNFMYSLGKRSQAAYPADFFDRHYAEDLFKTLYSDTITSPQVFSTRRPNVILIILESFTAGVVEPLGGVKGVTPNLNQLCSEGIVFDNFYASGDRTDKGIVSVLSAYPAQPTGSIIKSPAKSQRLPYLNHSMAELGFNTSFVYGGDLDFANFRSYLTNSNFGHITSEEDFPEDSPSGKWGVHDHIVFQRAFDECDSASQPFFKVILTLSSHEPFEVPMDPVFTGADEQSKFFNACHYTDKALGEFIRKARASAWWDNTVILLVADHGHRFPGNKPLMDAQRFRIPFLITGGAVKMDSVIHTFANQTDIANTLLGQVGEPSPRFRFSKDLFAPDAKSFAAYFFNNGYGFVAPGVNITYDNTGKQFQTKDDASNEMLELSKAYQQVLFTDYNSK